MIMKTEFDGLKTLKLNDDSVSAVQESHFSK
jgi:hypothetical protein